MLGVPKDSKERGLHLNASSVCFQFTTLALLKQQSLKGISTGIRLNVGTVSHITTDTVLYEEHE